MTPEYLMNMLDKKRLSAIFIWHLWEDWQGGAVEKHWMFKTDGTPEYWTEMLAPYFPLFAPGEMPEPIGWYGWSNGFEEGNFSAWNSTSNWNGELTVVTSPVHQETYSANLTLTSTITGSYARVHKLYAEDVYEFYARVWVRFASLPDVAGSYFDLLGFKNEQDIGGGNWFGVFGVTNDSGTVKWRWYIIDGSTQTNATPTVSVDTWYSIEVYVNATANGVGSLWVNNNLVLTQTGDFSENTPIRQVFPCLGVVNGNQSTVKTVYFDDFRIDDERIYSEIPIIIQTVSENDTLSAIEGVLINGTAETDAMGFYTWANLTLNQEYTFIVEAPTSSRPRWVVGADSFSWNGSHYTFTYNITESAHDILVRFYFGAESDVHLISATGRLTGVVPTYSSQFRNITIYMSETSTVLIDTQVRYTPSYYDVVFADEWFWHGLDYTFEVQSATNVTAVWR